MVPTIGEAWAYVPSALPAPLAWTNELVGQLSRAERMIGRLQGVMRDLDNPRMLIRPMLAREAVMSSQIEGTRADLENLYRDRAATNPSQPEQMKHWIGEIKNAESALRQGMELGRNLPIAKQLWLQLHRVLMDGVRGGHADPGSFRRIQNWIGPPGCSIAEATYVPPPPQTILDCLSDLEKFIHEPSDVPSLVRLAMIHYQFEAIHPFIDGNGRLGRLINTLLMADWNILAAPPIDLSTYFKRRQEDYYRLLLAVSQRGAWTEWVSFFLQGLGDQAGEAYTRAQRLVALRRRYRRRIKANDLPASMTAFIDRLFVSPYFTIKKAAKRIGVTYAAARVQVIKLETLGIVKEITGQKRNRIYLAVEIFDAINSPILNQETPHEAAAAPLFEQHRDQSDDGTR